jgi:hypothetical protein
MTGVLKVPAIRPDGLQLDEHRSYQEKLWTVERWAWAAFAAVTLAAILGASGAGGPLSHQLSQVGGGAIEHPRIARWQATDTIIVHFPGGSATRSLTLAPPFAQMFQVEDVQPPARRVEAGPEGEVLHFQLDQGGPAQVVMHIRALSPGLARYRASIDGGAPRDLRTFILP